MVIFFQMLEQPLPPPLPADALFSSDSSLFFGLAICVNCTPSSVEDCGLVPRPQQMALQQPFLVSVLVGFTLVGIDDGVEEGWGLDLLPAGRRGGAKGASCFFLLRLMLIRKNHRWRV